MPKIMSFSDLATSKARGARYASFTPRDLTRTDREFKKMFDAVLSMKAHRDWKFRLRPSALPFCQWAAMLSELCPEGAPEQDSFARDFYTSVGTVAHRVVQSWLGRAGYLFGPYQCRGCRNVEVALGWPKACPNGCGKPDWLYLEIDLKDADPTGEFSGAHADGLIRFDWMEPETYYLIDIKTCSLAMLPKPEYQFTSPWHQKYLHQTAIYAHLLNRSEDMHVVGTVFIMVPRDDPKQMRAIYYDQSETNGNIFREAVAKFRNAKRAAATGDTLMINRDCKKPGDNPDCPFAGICFDRSATEELFIKRNKNLPVLPSVVA